MEALLEKLHAYSRCLELEDAVSDWESRKTQLQIRLLELARNLQKKEQEQQETKAPAFFRKFFGKTEEKQIREITAAITAAQWELASLEKKAAAGKSELETLTQSRTDYENARNSMVPTPAQESRLMMEEISAFVPVARKTGAQLLACLEDAQIWNRQVAEENPYVAQAAVLAQRLREILSVLPEGVASVGSYLQNPGSFIQGNQTLETAMEQVQTIQTQLRLLMGE